MPPSDPLEDIAFFLDYGGFDVSPTSTATLPFRPKSAVLAEGAPENSNSAKDFDRKVERVAMSSVWKEQRENEEIERQVVRLWRIWRTVHEMVADRVRVSQMTRIGQQEMLTGFRDMNSRKRRFTSRWTSSRLSIPAEIKADRSE